MNGFFHVIWVFKDYKPEVPSHNSFESLLCGTLKNPHAIRKEKGTEFPVWFFLHPSKNAKVCKELWNPAGIDLFENQGHYRDLGFFFLRRAMVILKV